VKARLVRRLQKHVVNPVGRVLVRSRLLPTHMLLETAGRRTGRPRQVPVGFALEGDTVWIVAEHGQRADYIRNVQANPRVRVLLRGRWRTGTATVLTDDDPRQRLRRMGRPLNALAVRAAGTDLMTVRVDLDPEGPGDQRSS
jgi:deazaflavin-dependent oxidoreductase (nitroreductase family)